VFTRARTRCQAIELEPSNASSYNSRGLVHDKLGRLDQALADFTQARKSTRHTRRTS
jgi:Flp pilus assembly protein TadD